MGPAHSREAWDSRFRFSRTSVPTTIVDVTPWSGAGCTLSEARRRQRLQKWRNGSKIRYRHQSCAGSHRTSATGRFSQAHSAGNTRFTTNDGGASALALAWRRKALICRSVRKGPEISGFGCQLIVKSPSDCAPNSSRFFRVSTPGRSTFSKKLLTKPDPLKTKCGRLRSEVPHRRQWLSAGRTSILTMDRALRFRTKHASPRSFVGEAELYDQDT